MNAAEEQAPVVVVENLEKTFRDFWMRPRAKAVNGISFDIRRGEVFGLLGPNGSGKSTTIKILLGLLHPTRGRVAVLGRSPRDVKAKARVGYLPEESNLYPYLSARETIDFYGKLFNLTPQKMEGMDYFILQQGEQMVCGVLQMDANWEEMPPHWMGYFAVDNTDAALERVSAAGGKIMVPAFDMSYGRMAVIADPAGAVVSIVQLPSA